MARTFAAGLVAKLELTALDIPWLMIGRGKTEARVLKRAPHVRSYSIDNLYA